MRSSSYQTLELLAICSLIQLAEYPIRGKDMDRMPVSRFRAASSQQGDQGQTYRFDAPGYRDLLFAEAVSPFSHYLRALSYRR